MGVKEARRQLACFGAGGISQVGITAFLSAAGMIGVVLFTIAALFGALSFRENRGFFYSVSRGGKLVEDGPESGAPDAREKMGPRQS